ncbi:MAG: hypothetical protein A2007_00100 [Verrucomicrobia bacterium GWC2_42_7]|nr:MAG: hypothetical protein A2007_00100 [Verrucomicrobia bacterium GWC2_42_7]
MRGTFRLFSLIYLISLIKFSIPLIISNRKLVKTVKTIHFLTKNSTFLKFFYILCSPPGRDYLKFFLSKRTRRMFLLSVHDFSEKHPFNF